ncbi:hypothetical protein GGX14DRAFT_439832, partial [Mycena pura]
MSALSCYADSIIASLGAETLTDHSLLNLQSVFPKSLVLAALDLIDRENVLRCVGPNGHQCHFQVLGSTTTYNVFLDLPGPTPTYCTCPSFSYFVLSAESYIMCKHVLATYLARRMGRLLDRPLTAEGLESMLVQEYS